MSASPPQAILSRLVTVVTAAWFGISLALLAPLPHYVLFQQGLTPTPLPAHYRYHKEAFFGEGFITDARYNEVTHISRVINTLIKPTETFFDFTNKSALYLFSDRISPSPYSASYLAVTTAIQKRIVERLEQTTPPLVFLPAPGGALDRAPATLRSTRLAWWFLDRNFRFLYTDGLYFLITPERAALHGVTGAMTPLELIRIEDHLSERSLESIPAVWGHSSKKLLSLIREYAPLDLTPSSGARSGKDRWWSTSDSSVEITVPMDYSQKVAYLSFTLESLNTSDTENVKECSFTLHDDLLFPQPRVVTRWKGCAGRYIVPLGSYPTVRYGMPKSLRISLRGLPLGTWWRMSESALHTEDH
jgi:hypothetical protein